LPQKRATLLECGSFLPVDAPWGRVASVAFSFSLRSTVLDAAFAKNDKTDRISESDL
jgi:hypothetical protein